MADTNVGQNLSPRSKHGQSVSEATVQKVLVIDGPNKTRSSHTQKRNTNTNIRRTQKVLQRIYKSSAQAVQKAGKVDSGAKYASEMVFWMDCDGSEGAPDKEIPSESTHMHTLHEVRGQVVM